MKLNNLKLKLRILSQDIKDLSFNDFENTEINWNNNLPIEALLSLMKVKMNFHISPFENLDLPRNEDFQFSTKRMESNKRDFNRTGKQEPILKN